MTDREIMQQALEALEAMQSYAAAERKGLRICDEAIASLRERLAQPEQEPFGYFQYSMHLDAWVQNKEEIKGIAFYTSPPQRKPLTEEEIEDLYFDCFSMGELKAFARAVERAHGIGEKE